VKERGRESGGVEAHVREDVGDFEEVRKIGIAGRAKLVAMTLSSDFVGAANNPRIFGRTIEAELGEELFEAGIELALEAVAVELQRNIAGRRHKEVYAGTERRARRRKKERGAPKDASLDKSIYN